MRRFVVVLPKLTDRSSHILRQRRRRQRRRRRRRCEKKVREEGGERRSKDRDEEKKKRMRDGGKGTHSCNRSIRHSSFLIPHPSFLISNRSIVIFHSSFITHISYFFIRHVCVTAHLHQIRNNHFLVHDSIVFQPIYRHRPTVFKGSKGPKGIRVRGVSITVSITLSTRLSITLTGSNTLGITVSITSWYDSLIIDTYLSMKGS